MTLDEHNDAVRVMLGDLLRRQEALEAQLLEMTQRDSAERRAERAEDIERMHRAEARRIRLGIASQLLASPDGRDVGSALYLADALIEAEGRIPPGEVAP